MSLPLLIIGLLLFVGLVIVHELGHFIVARRNGVEVEEFGIGFPPRAFKKRMKSGFLLTINWLPLGGFVRLKGEHDADQTPGSFGVASVWAKSKVMVAGVVMNLVTAFVLLTILAAVGMPKLLDYQFSVPSDTKVVRNDVLVGYVEPDSPAATAGLKTEDRLLSITNNDAALQCPMNALCAPMAQPVTSASQLPSITKEAAGSKVTIRIERNGRPEEVVTTLRSKQEVDASKKTDNPKGYLGVAPSEYTIQRSTWSSPVVAAGTMWQFTTATFKGLGNALAGLFQGNTTKASSQVSGPVGVFVLLKDGSLLGYQFIIMIIAIISLTLAIMNILPIPALDGGRLFVMLLFRAAKKPLKKGTEDLIHGLGFAGLMLLFILITVVDVKRFF